MMSPGSKWPVLFTDTGVSAERYLAICFHLLDELLIAA